MDAVVLTAVWNATKLWTTPRTVPDLLEELLPQDRLWSSDLARETLFPDGLVDDGMPPARVDHDWM